MRYGAVDREEQHMQRPRDEGERCDRNSGDSPSDLSLAHVQGGERGAQVQLLKGSHLACWAMALDHG